MGSCLICFVLVIAVSGRTCSYPLDETNLGDRNREDLRGNQNVNVSSCNYKGNAHNEGDVINVDEPCLLCQCSKGALICGLRICSDLPDPPPSGCYVVHGTNQCCPQLLCETKKVESDIEVRTVPGPRNGSKECTVNGSTYAEGSALKSSHPCEYCYCIQGQQKCIKPKCAMPFEGCKAIYSKNSCCPTHYDCRSEAAVDVSKPQQEKPGCEVDGIKYAEGEIMPRSGSSCRNCYCVEGEIRCVPIFCGTEFGGDCEPIHGPGQCCPTSYICPNMISGVSESSIRAFSKRLETVTNFEAAISQEADQESNAKVTTDVSVGATEPATTSQEESTTFAGDAEESARTRMDFAAIPDDFTETGLHRKNQDATAFDVEESTPVPVTVRPVPIRTASGDAVSRNREGHPSEKKAADNNTALSPAELFGGTPQGDEEYDSYDYTEPRLPPSLPNLIIFPFVAADAVVKDDEASKMTNYDEGSIKRIGTEIGIYKDYFSPPVKTEGGFIPKEPPVLEGSYDKKTYLGKEDKCLLRGQIYEHGEFLPKPENCQSCICYYGDVVCQEIVCPPLGEGCERILEKDKKSCCGRIVCDSEDSRTVPKVIDFMHSTERNFKGSFTTVIDSNEPTPVTFRDVIRTETAPDLPSLMGDLLPVYEEQQTKKPVTVTYKNLIVDYYPDFLITTARDDIRKMNYKNPVFYATEINPFTNNVADKVKSRFTTPDTSGNHTFPIHSTVTSSTTTSSSYSSAKDYNAEHFYSNTQLVKTSIRPILTVATEPTSHFERSNSDKRKTDPKQEGKDTVKRTGQRPIKKTTENTGSIKEEAFITPSHKAPNGGKHKYSTKTKPKITASAQIKDKHETQTKSAPEKNIVQDSFSLDSVLRFFFNTETTTPAPLMNSFVTTRKTTKKEVNKKFSPTPLTTSKWDEEFSRHTMDSREALPEFRYKEIGEKVQSIKETDDYSKRNSPDPNYLGKKYNLGGILKVAGCNIYGRMYRVGKVITELSNPCLECVCTDFGVECNPLIC